MSPRFTPIRIALLLGLLLSLTRASGCRYLDLIDARLGDYRLIQRGKGDTTPDVVIVAVDDESIKQVGRWPWSRAVVARLIDRLVEADAAVIGFDIVQSEATAAYDVGSLRDHIAGVDDRTWDAVRQALRAGATEDAMLAEAVRSSGRTVLGYFFDNSREDHGSAIGAVRPYNQVRGNRTGEDTAHLPQAGSVTGNLPELTAASRDLGYFTFFTDRDGSLRRVPLAVRYGDEIIAPLALAMLRNYRGSNPLTIRFDDNGVESLAVGATEIPVRSDGQLLINFRGPRKTFPHVSAQAVLAGQVPADLLRGKLVLVGVTAEAVYDLRVTPFGGLFPGVEIHANILDNILRGDFLIRPWWVPPAETLLILASVLLLGILLQYARGVTAAVTALLVVVGYLVISQWLFVSSGLVLTVIYPPLAIGLTYIAISVQHYAVEERERRKTRKALELYLSPSLAAMVSEHPEALKLGGEKRERTVLFSDVRGFTTISERLEPEMLVDLLNAYLGEMTAVIFAHDGMLDKYIGDAIMAVWGAPLPQADHAARACAAALEMASRLQALQPEWQQRGWPKLESGIGLNSGQMVFGNMGSAQHLSLTVMGDNVNLGSRLEGLTKLYGTTIIASEATLQAAGPVAVVRELDLVRVKGKLQPVRIFELLGPASDQARWADLIARSDAALLAYRERRWADAIAAFKAVLENHPDDGPAILYLQRCQAMQTNPPPQQWDGVTVMVEK